jgi:hypothetical protein
LRESPVSQLKANFQFLVGGTGHSDLQSSEWSNTVERVDSPLQGERTSGGFGLVRHFFGVSLAAA